VCYATRLRTFAVQCASSGSDKTIDSSVISYRCAVGLVRLKKSEWRNSSSVGQIC
jgi:hypothetical protein